MKGAMAALRGLLPLLRVTSCVRGLGRAAAAAPAGRWGFPSGSEERSVGYSHQSSAVLVTALRGLRSSPSVWMPEKLTIVVPSMGDSIVEGTIANVLKGPGEAVKEDEVIAQIETDKVTVDIRAPTSGTISNILVKADDNVVIGQTVAFLVPGEGPSPASASASASAPAAPPPPPSAVPPPSSGHRVPSVRFPRRMTPSGQRLSALPAAEQQAALAAMQPPGPSSAPAPPSPPKAPKAAERASQHPKRYPYSEKEIEAIMLGGAGGLDINISVQVNVEL